MLRAVFATIRSRTWRALRRTSTALLVVVVLAFAWPGTSDASAVTSIGAGISGPSGLSATVYARGVKHISALAADAEGRIWAATATGTTDDAAAAVVMIPRAGASPVTVIDDVDTPLGLVWLDDALYVARRAGVERYSGFDGTSFAEHHAVLTLPDGVGEVNGLALSADGHFVVGVSAPCDACTPTSQWSASVVTFLPDGTDARVYASGLRAAVGFAYFPGTNDLFATLNQRDDLGARTPGDWLALLADGQRWGFPKCYGQGGRVCDGVPEPVAELDVHAAVSGVGIVTEQLGAHLGTGAAVAEWMTGKVKFVSLTKQADGYRGRATTLLTGFSHPMPVLVTRDRALLVGDWGTGRIVRITSSL
jgi:glucose/arabinose dehydrogenase